MGNTSEVVDALRSVVEALGEGPEVFFEPRRNRPLNLRPLLDGVRLRGLSCVAGLAAATSSVEAALFSAAAEAGLASVEVLPGSFLLISRFAVRSVTKSGDSDAAAGFVSEVAEVVSLSKEEIRF